MREFSGFLSRFAAKISKLPAISAGVASIGLAGVLVITVGLTPAIGQSQKSSRATDTALTPDELYARRLEGVVRAMNSARDRHLLKPDKPQLVEGAIRGLLAGLDPDAEYYNRAQVMAIAGKSSRSATLLDIGVQVRRLPAPPRRPSPGLRVVSVADGSPAARVGIGPDAIITHINGKTASDMTRLELESLHLRANVVGAVVLSVQLKPNAEAIDILVEREAGAAARTDIIQLPDGMLYARLSRLTDSNVRNAVLHLEEKSKILGSKVSGLILDLRDLADEDYDGAVHLADALLESGTITRRSGRRQGEQAKDYPARPGSILRSKPVAVLVNAGTAGAAEVLAGALQDNRRATLIGRQTAGQAVIRSLTSVDPAGERGFVMLATARYHTPNGRALDKTGLDPDIKLAAPVEARCREIDRPADDGAGLCQRRPVGNDPALAAAIEHLARAKFAGGARQN